MKAGIIRHTHIQPTNGHHMMMPLCRKEDHHGGPIIPGLTSSGQGQTRPDHVPDR